MANFFATGPISEPIQSNHVLTDDMGGFGWDQQRGMFIPVQEELDMFIAPLPPHGSGAP